jgi:hypothetical protein
MVNILKKGFCMYRHIFFILSILCLFACSEEVANVDYKGIWIAKNNGSDSSIISPNNKKNLNIEAMYFKENGTDSVAFYINQDSVFQIFGFNKYDTYYLKFDDINEAFIVYDYTTHELLYRDIKRKQTTRFYKIDSASKPLLYQKYKKVALHNQ